MMLHIDRDVARYLRTEQHVYLPGRLFVTKQFKSLYGFCKRRRDAVYRQLMGTEHR